MRFRTALLRLILLPAGISAAIATAGEAAAQGVLERSPLLAGPTVGLPWTLAVDPVFRFDRDSADASGSGSTAAGGTRMRATFDLALGLPAWALAGVRFTPQAAVGAGRPDEWEAYVRRAMMKQAAGAILDVAVQAGFNSAATSVDGEVVVGRWTGPLRLLGAGRLFTDAYGEGATRGAIAAGAVLLPRARRVPISLSVDAATLIDRNAAAGERVAWSVGAAVGVSHSTHTLALMATNTESGSLHGISRGAGALRIALTFTVPVGVGQLAALTVPRHDAMRAVIEAAPATGEEVRTDIERFAYPEYRIVVSRGATIEWTNRDAVMHTVTADDGSWNPGAISPGSSWRARFDEPGIYPFHCGPHPYMKGAVIVR
jgi:plastocyanin